MSEERGESSERQEGDQIMPGLGDHGEDFALTMREGYQVAQGQGSDLLQWVLWLAAIS